MASSTERGDIAELRKYIKAYKPGKAVNTPDRVKFPANMYIGLFGKTGCGKTSLINSLKFAAQGKLREAQWLQVAQQTKAGGHTMYRKIADLTKHIYVIDNRGLDDPVTNAPNNDQGTSHRSSAMREIKKQLDGERGYGEKVKWKLNEGEESSDESSDGSSDDSDSDSDSESVDSDDSHIDSDTKHKISCAVFVFSIEHDILSNITGLHDMVDFIHMNQGRYPLAVITHVDLEERTDDVDELRTVLEVAGVSHIFEVANITIKNSSLADQYQLNLLSFLERCMTDGDETIIFKHYQQKDAKKRMKKQKKKQHAQERAHQQVLEAYQVDKEQEFERQLEQMRTSLAAREQEQETRLNEKLETLEQNKAREIQRIIDANRQNDDSASDDDSVCVLL